MIQTDLDAAPMLNGPFDSKAGVRLVFGVNSVDRVGELARELRLTKMLLVTDSGIVAAGHAGRVRKALESAGIAVTVFDKVMENPTTGCVDRCVEAAREAAIDGIVGLGGGSSMDTAKGCNFLLTNGGRMEDYWGIGKAAKPMLPLIAIPTTAGTGSECQSFALITDESTHRKMACGDPKAAPRIAILDPGLTVSQPARVTACTGIDAIAHALETAVTRKRNPLSMLYSQGSFRMTLSSFHRVIKNPNDLDARGQMLLGAALGGMAIENSMLGAAHAAANPLTAQYNIIHGMAVGLMLPAVIRFNAQLPAARLAYEELAAVPEMALLTECQEDPVEALASHVEWLLNTAGMPRSLAAAGANPSGIPALALEAVKQWTAGFNPRPLTAHEFENLFAAAFKERS
jgi:alcohol dehydrogenase